MIGESKEKTWGGQKPLIKFLRIVGGFEGGGKKAQKKGRRRAP